MRNEVKKGVLEPERSGGDKAPLKRFDSEVQAIAKRRQFTQEYKLKILRELDQCRGSGEIGLILRREGLYSTNISRWRKWRSDMGSKSGKPTQANALKNENARLKRQVTTLEAKLERANKLLEIQKKMAEFVENWEKENSEGNPSG